MSVKVCFYSSETGDCIYSIKAGEICSEFISRYFFKPGDAPDKFINTIVKSDSIEELETTKQEILKNIYKVKIEDMIQDSKKKFEFNTFKESKFVREKLLNKYQDMKEKIDIYALLGLED